VRINLDCEDIINVSIDTSDKRRTSSASVLHTVLMALIKIPVYQKNNDKTRQCRILITKDIVTWLSLTSTIILRHRIDCIATNEIPLEYQFTDQQSSLNHEQITQFGQSVTFSWRKYARNPEVVKAGYTQASQTWAASATHFTQSRIQNSSAQPHRPHPVLLDGPGFRDACASNIASVMYRSLINKRSLIYVKVFQKCWKF